MSIKILTRMFNLNQLIMIGQDTTIVEIPKSIGAGLVVIGNGIGIVELVVLQRVCKTTRSYW